MNLSTKLIVFGVFLILVGASVGWLFQNLAFIASLVFLGAAFAGGGLLYSFGQKKLAGYLIVTLLVMALVAFFRPELLGIVLK